MRARLRSRAAPALAAAALLGGCLLGDSAPAPQDDRARTAEDQPVEIRVLDNDYNAPDVSLDLVTTNGLLAGNSPTLFGDSPPNILSAHGLIRRTLDSTVIYTPNPDFHGEDHFFYVVSNAGGTARAKVMIEVAPDSERFGEPATLHSGTHAMRAFAAELDGNPLPDLFVQEGDGDRVLALIQEPGPALRVVQAFGEPKCCLKLDQAPVVADFDGDGLSDLVRFLDNGRFEVQMAQPSADGVRFEPHLIERYGLAAVEFEEASLRHAPVKGGAAGDFDGDGEMDLALGLNSSRYGLIMYLGMRSGVPRAVQPIALSPVSALTTGDITRDAIADVVAVFEGDAVGVIYVDRANDGFAHRLYLLAIRAEPAWPHAADVDGLPGEEIVVLHGGIAEVLHAPAEQAPLDLVLSATSVDLVSDPALADLDGDGRADLLGPGHMYSGLRLWSAATEAGAPGFTFTGDFPVMGYPGRSPLVVDFDRDGRLDVIASRQSMSELVLLAGQ